MELNNYLAILWRRKWIILIVAVGTVGIVTAGTFWMTPLYSTTTTLRVATASGGSVDTVNYDINYTDRLIKTYAQVATSGPMLGGLSAKLGVSKLPKIGVINSTNTELMQITAEDPNPLLAQNAANNLAELLIAYARNSDVQGDKTTLDSLGVQLVQAQSDMDKARQQYETLAAQTPKDADQVAAANQLMQSKLQAYTNLFSVYQRVQAWQSVHSNVVSVVEPAAFPTAPSSPRIPLNIALGSLVGLAGGVMLAFLVENLDTTLYTTEQIHKVTGLPVLGRIPVSKKKASTFLNGASPEGEAFRHLRTRILNMPDCTSPHALMVTSAEPGEGKSTVVSNLAYSLAQSGQRVLVIDCDLRAPSLHRIFGLPNEVGLSTILGGPANPSQAVPESQVPGVWLITSGPIPSNPSELLGSVKMRDLLVQVTAHFDKVLLDTTSLLAVTDTLVLAPTAEAIVMVVARARTSEGHARAACELLKEANAIAIGVVVNHAEPDYEYGFYHKAKPKGQVSKKASW
jgi:tyrosine-protein kinase